MPRTFLSGEPFGPLTVACCIAAPLQGSCAPSDSCRCKAGADHLARAVRGVRIVRAVLEEEACNRESADSFVVLLRSRDEDRLVVMGAVSAARPNDRVCAR